MPMHALILCKLDVRINRIPVDKELEGAWVLGLGSSVRSLETLWLSESVQSVFQYLSRSVVGIFRCFAVLELENRYFVCCDVVLLAQFRASSGGDRLHWMLSCDSSARTVLVCFGQLRSMRSWSKYDRHGC